MRFNGLQAGGFREKSLELVLKRLQKFSDQNAVEGFELNLGSLMQTANRHPNLRSILTLRKSADQHLITRLTSSSDSMLGESFEKSTVSNAQRQYKRDAQLF